MQPSATNVAHGVVCVSVSVLGTTGELCKEWQNQSTCHWGRGADSCGSKNHVFDSDPDPPRKGAL